MTNNPLDPVGHTSGETPDAADGVAEADSARAARALRATEVLMAFELGRLKVKKRSSGGGREERDSGKRGWAVVLRRNGSVWFKAMG